MSQYREFKINGEPHTIPTDRFYGRENHMWAQYDPSTGQVIIGMDELGITALGDLAYVTLLPAGAQVERGKSIGKLEAAKMTGDLSSPVSGVIVARNENAIRNPGLINQDAYQAGWLVVIQPTNWDEESAQLISGQTLPDWVDGEVERYRQQGWID